MWRTIQSVNTVWLCCFTSFDETWWIIPRFQWYILLFPLFRMTLLQHLPSLNILQKSCDGRKVSLKHFHCIVKKQKFTYTRIKSSLIRQESLCAIILWIMMNVFLLTSSLSYSNWLPSSVLVTCLLRCFQWMLSLSLYLYLQDILSLFACLFLCRKLIDKHL